LASSDLQTACRRTGDVKSHLALARPFIGSLDRFYPGTKAFYFKSLERAMGIRTHDISAWEGL